MGGGHVSPQQGAAAYSPTSSGSVSGNDDRDVGQTTYSNERYETYTGHGTPNDRPLSDQIIEQLQPIIERVGLEWAHIASHAMLERLRASAAFTRNGIVQYINLTTRGVQEALHNNALNTRNFFIASTTAIMAAIGCVSYAILSGIQQAKNEILGEIPKAVEGGLDKGPCLEDKSQESQNTLLQIDANPDFSKLRVEDQRRTLERKNQREATDLD